MSRLERAMTALLVLLLATLTSACIFEEEAKTSKELRVAVFGTTSEMLLRTIVSEAFESLTPCKISFIGGTSRLHLQELRSSEDGRPPFDVVLLDGIIQEVAAAEGHLERSSELEIPEIDELLPQAQPRVDGGPAMYFYSVGILYNPGAFVQAGIPEPKTWGDFWNPALKGHVAVPQIYHASGIDFVQAAASVAGGSRGTIEGLKAGVDHIAKLEPAMVYSSLEPLLKEMEAGKIWILPAYSYSAHRWIQQGRELAFIHPKDKGFGHVTTINKVKNTDRDLLANKFISLVLSKGFQYGLAIETPFGPVRRDVITPLSRFPRLVERFPCGEKGFSKLFVPHWETLNELRPSVEAYWFKHFPSR